MSGIEEGRQDKSWDEACLLLYVQQEPFSLIDTKNGGPLCRPTGSTEVLSVSLCRDYAIFYSFSNFFVYI